MPVRSDPALAEALAALDLGHEVPEALWVAVAETLAWAYRLDEKARRGAAAAALTDGSGDFAEEQLVLVEVLAQRALQLGVDLADAALGDAEHVADLAQRQVVT